MSELQLRLPSLLSRANDETQWGQWIYDTMPKIIVAGRVAFVENATEKSKKASGREVAVGGEVIACDPNPTSYRIVAPRAEPERGLIAVSVVFVTSRDLPQWSNPDIHARRPQLLGHSETHETAFFLSRHKGAMIIGAFRLVRINELVPPTQQWDSRPSTWEHGKIVWNQRYGEFMVIERCEEHSWLILRTTEVKPDDEALWVPKGY